MVQPILDLKCEIHEVPGKYKEGFVMSSDWSPQHAQCKYFACLSDIVVEHSCVAVFSNKLQTSQTYKNYSCDHVSVLWWIRLCWVCLCLAWVNRTYQINLNRDTYKPNLNKIWFGL